MKRIKTSVIGHVRHMASGKPVWVKKYERKLVKSNKIVPFKKDYTVKYFRNQRTGQIVAKRIYKKA